jgi:hypothetical protein
MIRIPALVKQFIELKELRGFRYALVKFLKFIIYDIYSITLWLFTPFEYLRFLAKNPQQWRKRVEVIKRFCMIHRAIPCFHTEGELLRIADEVLSIPNSLEGDIIECGVGYGGGTCKLSIIAKLTGRKLVACDSFSGLPTPNQCEDAYFKKGEFSVSVNEVRENITRFGSSDSVELVEGTFRETLPRLKNRKFILIFEDADLHKSASCCVENLWPALQPGCKMYTHNLPYPAIQAYTDKGFWLQKFGYPPPPLCRAGVFTRNLGYIKKPCTLAKKKH